MRTTVTLDPDTESLIRQEMALKRKSFKQVLNEAVCQGLRSRPAAQKATQYKTMTFRSGYQPGIDRGRLQQIADDLEIQAAHASRGKAGA